MEIEKIKIDNKLLTLDYSNFTSTETRKHRTEVNNAVKQLEDYKKQLKKQTLDEFEKLWSEYNEDNDVKLKELSSVLAKEIITKKNTETKIIEKEYAEEFNKNKSNYLELLTDDEFKEHKKTLKEMYIKIRKDKSAKYTENEILDYIADEILGGVIQEEVPVVTQEEVPKFSTFKVTLKEPLTRRDIMVTMRNAFKNSTIDF